MTFERLDGAYTKPFPPVPPAPPAPTTPDFHDLLVVALVALGRPLAVSQQDLAIAKRTVVSVSHAQGGGTWTFEAIAANGFTDVAPLDPSTLGDSDAV